MHEGASAIIRRVRAHKPGDGGSAFLKRQRLLLKKPTTLFIPAAPQNPSSRIMSLLSPSEWRARPLKPCQIHVKKTAAFSKGEAGRRTTTELWALYVEAAIISAGHVLRKEEGIKSEENDDAAPFFFFFIINSSSNQHRHTKKAHILFQRFQRSDTHRQDACLATAQLPSSELRSNGRAKPGSVLRQKKQFPNTTPTPFLEGFGLVVNCEETF